ncbi:MAG TPA: GerMN domain-containing protein, partial [Acidimicrobiia bacterium]|nr:GerMN domain-containing protein [Acidimicrobiia bacterium]
EDQPIYAPMGTAERIAGGPPRRQWPVWALAGGLALAALLAGGGWLLWIRGGAQDIVATSNPGTTHAPTTTVVPAGEPPTGDAVVYFYVADDGTQLGAGPYLIPVARPLAVLSHFVTDPVYEAVNFLLTGTAPGEEEADQPLVSYIPEGTRLLGVEVAGGVATVDFSSEFAGDGDTDAAFRPRIAQVVFTLTRFPDIDGVRFLIEGVPSANLNAAMTGDPATRADFEDLLPAVMIESPAYWASSGDNPLAVSGTANVFEAVVSLELLDQAGSVLWEGTTMTTCGTGCRGDFSLAVPYDVGEAQFGTLVAWETSMRDDSRTNVRQHPVWLRASGDATTSTLDPISAQLALRYDLDKAVEATLAEIEVIHAQLTGLPLDQGTALRTRAAELDRDLSELRDGLSRVYDGLLTLGADFEMGCSAAELGAAFVDQPDLPDPAQDIRHALFDAARSCDWDTLRSLLDHATFSYSFGESGDPVAYWQHEEFLHYRPMYYLAAILERPFGMIEDGDSTIYTWPSAQTYESWAQVPAAEREALRPLYDDLDFRSFDEFGGYLGFRVGIRSDEHGAQWIYAITGD